MVSERIRVLWTFLIILSFGLTACSYAVNSKNQHIETKEVTRITSQPPLESTHNLKDMGGFKKNDKFSFPVDLNSWGKVNFISGEFTEEQSGSTTEYPEAFLADDKDNILYEFDNLSTTGTRIIDVSIKDLNGDGLKDVKITLAFFDYDTDKIISDMPKLERIFYQMDNGIFSDNTHNGK